MRCYYSNFQPTRSFGRIISTIRSRYSANLNRFYAPDLTGRGARPRARNIKLAMKRFDNWVLKSCDNRTLCAASPNARGPFLLQIFMTPRICHRATCLAPLSSPLRPSLFHASFRPIRCCCLMAAKLTPSSCKLPVCQIN